VYWTTLVFEWLFCPEERKLDKPIFKSSNAWGVAQGGDVEASVCVEASV